jgi:hypothetical protein
MNRAIIEASRPPLAADKVSRQKTDALFELAARIGLLAEQSRSSQTVLAKAAASERRKSLKTGLELVAAGADGEAIDRGIAAAAPRPEADPGASLEWMLVRAGMRSIAADEHYSVAMRRMTAYLETSYFEKAEAWLL